MLATRHTHLSASGALGSRSAALKVDFKATSLAEFQALLDARWATAPVPVELARRGEFNGTLEGRLRELQIAGHLQASNFTYVYTPATTTQAQPTRSRPQRKSFFHPAAAPPPQTPPSPRRNVFTSTSSPRTCSTRRRELRCTTPSSWRAMRALLWMARPRWSKGNFTENSAFQVRAAMHDADVAALQRTVGLDYPVTGTLNFTVQAAGTQANPSGKGQFSLTSAQAYGRPIKSLTANILFTNHEAQLNEIRLLAARGSVTGSAAYNLTTKAIALRSERREHRPGRHSGDPDRASANHRRGPVHGEGLGHARGTGHQRPSAGDQDGPERGRHRRSDRRCGDSWPAAQAHRAFEFPQSDIRARRKCRVCRATCPPT